MQEHKIDSAKQILTYWENKCGMREPIFRARILIALEQNEFHDSLLTNGVLSNIFNYQNRREIISNSLHYYYDGSPSYYGFVPPGQEFDEYTMKLAESVINKYNPETIEYLLAKFYGVDSDTIFSKLQSDMYTSSKLKIEYQKSVSKYVDMPEFHISFLSGVWIPTGDLEILGVHPELGFQMGAKHKKMNYDLTIAIRFLRASNYYYARRTKTTDSLELTNHFFGAHIGFDMGRDIYIKNGHEIQLTTGVAFDGFDALEEDVDNEIEPESTFSYNFSFGLGYRYYLTNTFYLGLRAKYNIVDYSLNNVIDFTGNPITIHFIIGGLSNYVKNDNLKALKYNLRK